jgi:hypothetical protein
MQHLPSTAGVGDPVVMDAQGNARVFDSLAQPFAIVALKALLCRSVSEWIACLTRWFTPIQPGCIPAFQSEAVLAI